MASADLAEGFMVMFGQAELAASVGEWPQDQFAVVADNGGSERVVPPARGC